MFKKDIFLSCLILFVFIISSCGSDKKESKSTDDPNKKYNLIITYKKDASKKYLLDFDIKFDHIEITNLPEKINSLVKQFVTGGKINTLNGSGIIPFEMEVAKTADNIGVLSIFAPEEIVADNKKFKHEVIWSVNSMAIPLVPNELPFIKGYSGLKVDQKARILDIILSKDKINEVPNSYAKGLDEKVKQLISLPENEIKVGEKWENSINDKRQVFGLPPIFYGQGDISSDLNIIKTLLSVKNNIINIGLEISVNSTGNFSESDNKFDYRLEINSDGDFSVDTSLGLISDVKLKIKSKIDINIASFAVKQQFFEETFKDTKFLLEGEGKLTIKTK